MKYVWCAVLLIGLLILPRIEWKDEEDTICLARMLYALGRDEDEETLLMLGSVVMNRVDSPCYPDTVSEVLREMNGILRDMLYDERTLRTARALMMGRRELPAAVLSFSAENGSEGGALYAASEGFGFYKDKTD